MSRELSTSSHTSPALSLRGSGVGEAIFKERMDDKTLIQRIIAKIEVWLGNPPEPIIQEEEDNGKIG
jgi:hypothetical protein